MATTAVLIFVRVMMIILSNYNIYNDDNNHDNYRYINYRFNDNNYNDNNHVKNKNKNKNIPSIIR